MPQMFPLLWMLLFIMTATALYSMMALTHFSQKKCLSNLTSPELFEDHNWKW